MAGLAVKKTDKDYHMMGLAMHKSVLNCENLDGSNVMCPDEQ